MALARIKRRTNLATGGTPSDRVNTWSSIPNASVGKSVEKSIKQVIRDGGIRGHGPVYHKNGKDIGMEITTKKGNKIQIKDLIAVRDIKKNRKK